jgi:hypothetical protein
MVVGSPMFFVERGTFELSSISESWALFRAEAAPTAG